jgi:hypothetical protein
MKPIAIHPDDAAPPFADDPVAWLAWAEGRVRAGKLTSVAAQHPSRFEARGGAAWRLVRTDEGVELRPALVNGFLRRSPNPMISAIGIGERVVVELTSTQGTWVGSFAPDELELAQLGRAMLDRRHLPHDNLRLLFGAPAEA